MRQNIITSKSMAIPRGFFKSITYRTKINPQDCQILKTPTCTIKTATSRFYQSARTSFSRSGQLVTKRQKGQSQIKQSKYLSIFHQHMDLSKPSSSLKQQFKRKSRINIRLPQVHDVPQSHFTVLQPVNFPIQFVQNGIRNVQRQFIKLEQYNSDIKNSFEDISSSCLSKLQQIQQTIYDRLRNWKQLVRKDRIKHQSHRTEVTQLINQTQQGFQQIANQFNIAVEKALDIQKQIFENELPFELQQQEEGEIIDSYI